MSDVSAVVLSIGEPYTERAIASLQGQTLPVAETIVVRGVSPFHCALNHGAAQVRTPFFVQVDADMILDPTCLAELRGRVDDSLGMVSAHLRDAVIGRAHGIRLYRTACFERVQIRDTISPDRDFTLDIGQHGWGRLCTLRYGERPEHWHTLGEHRPDYTPQYTFAKFLLEGVRSRYRLREGRVRRIFTQLQASPHRIAPIALIGAAHGLFRIENRDLLAPYGYSDDFRLLDGFLNGPPSAAAPSLPMDEQNGCDLQQRFARAYRSGFALCQAGAPAPFLARLDQLRQQGGLAAWISSVAMCHGLFHREGNGSADDAFASLDEILAQGTPWEHASSR